MFTKSITEKRLQFASCLTLADQIIARYRAAAPDGCDPQNIERLKRVYTAQDDIPEAYRGLFEEKDGKFVPNFEIEGLVPAAKVEEFRTNNQKLLTRAEQAEAKLEGIDLDEYASLKERSKELEEGKLIKKGDTETVIKQRVAEATAPLTQQINALKKEKDETTRKLTTELEDSWMQNQIIEKGLPMGLHDTAIADIKSRAKGIFIRGEDGQIRAVDSDGKTTKVNPSTQEPYTMEDFLQEQLKGNGKHLFKDSTGSGTHQKVPGGGGGPNGYSGVNPWDPKTINRSEQSRILIKDFALAQRLAGKHGVVVERPNVAV